MRFSSKQSKPTSDDQIDIETDEKYFPVERTLLEDTQRILDDSDIVTDENYLPAERTLLEGTQKILDDPNIEADIENWLSADRAFSDDEQAITSNTVDAAAKNNIKSSLPEHFQGMLKAAIHGDEGAWKAYKLCHYNEEVRKAYTIDFDTAFLDFFTEQLQSLSKEKIDCLSKDMLRGASRMSYADKLDKQKKFVDVLKKNIDTQNIEIPHSLIVEFDKNMVFQDKEFAKKIYKIYKKKFERGDQGAGYILCLCYYFGLGVEKDLEKSFLMSKNIVLASGAESFSHYPEVTHLLAGHFANGEGIEKNWDTACKYTEQAADNNYELAQHNLGLFFENENVRPKAIAFYKKAAKQGYVTSQYKLGELYKKNKPEKSFKFFKQAAMRGHSAAQYEVGLCYQKGIGVTPDYNKMLSYLLRAANRGSVDAFFALDPYRGNYAVRETQSSLFSKYKKEAQKGSKNAQYALGLFYEKEGDFLEAYHYYQKSAEKTHTKALYKLGCLLYEHNGKDFAQNPQEAFRCFQKAASDDHKQAYYKLGICYEMGFGINKDSNKAIESYTTAAAMGIAEAQYKLGLYHKTVTKDLLAAFEYFKEAAENDLSKAQMQVADFYWYGNGVIEDKNEAIAWYQRAADQDVAQAHYILGNQYLFGHVIQKEVQKALTHFEIAAKAGIVDAQFNLASTYLDTGSNNEEKRKQIFKLYQSASKQGHVDSVYMLGHCYEQGIGVERNYSDAAQCYWAAMNSGYSKAKDPYYRCKSMSLEQRKLREQRERALRSERSSNGPPAIILDQPPQKPSQPNKILMTKSTSQSAHSPNNPTTTTQTSPASVQRTSPVPLNLEQTIFSQQPTSTSASRAPQKSTGSEIIQGNTTGPLSGQNAVNANTMPSLIQLMVKHLTAYQVYLWCKQAACLTNPEALHCLGYCHEVSLGVAGNLSEAIKYYSKAQELGYQQANAALTRCFKKRTQQPFPAHLLSHPLTNTTLSKPLMNTIRALQNQQASAQVSHAPKKNTDDGITQRNTMGPPVNTNATTTTIRQARQNPARSSEPDSMQPPLPQEPTMQKIKIEPGVSPKSTKRRRSFVQPLVQSNLPKEPKQKKVKTESTSIQHIKRVLSVDEKTLLRIVKKLRATSCAQYNCIRYVDALLRYFMTSVEPTEAVNGRPAPLSYFRVMCFDHSVAVKSETPKQRMEVRSADIPTGLQFGHTFYRAEHLVSGGDNSIIDLDAPYVINLEENKKLTSVHHTKINSHLMEQARHAPNQVAFGYIGLARCGKYLKESGHGIAYYVTPDKVYYIDCQRLKYNKKTQTWKGTPIFYDLARDKKHGTGYDFVKKDNPSPGENEFQSTVFTTPLWPVPGVHYTPKKGAAGHFTH